MSYKGYGQITITKSEYRDEDIKEALDLSASNDEKLSSLEQKVLENSTTISDTQLLVDQNTQAINAKVSQDVYDAKVQVLENDLSKANNGLNKWIYEIYPKSLFPSDDQSKHTIDVFVNNKDLVPINTYLVEDSKLSAALNYRDNYIAYALTFVYFDKVYDYVSTIQHNDAITVYLNGASVYTNNKSVSSAQAISIAFKKGWNCLEVVLNENTDSDGFIFIDAISKLEQCSLMNCYYATVTGRDQRISNKLVDINTSLNGITTRVEQTESDIKGIDSDVTTLQNNYSTFTQDYEGFKTTVGETYATKDELDDTNNNLSETHSIATQTADQFKWLVDSESTSSSITLTDSMIDAVTKQFIIKSPDGTQTVITGGKILTNSITSSMLATDAIRSRNYQASTNSSSPYTVKGTYIDLSNGNIYTPAFGVNSTTATAYLNGEINAFSGIIGDTGTGAYWEIGTTINTNMDAVSSLVAHGGAMMDTGRLALTKRSLHSYNSGNYIHYDGNYYDFGFSVPILETSTESSDAIDRDEWVNETVSRNVLYIRKSKSDEIPSSELNWDYLFRIDNNGMIWMDGKKITDIFMSKDDDLGATYLSLTNGGTVQGNVTINGTLTANASSASKVKNAISVNGKTYDGSSAVTVGTIGVSYGGTGKTSWTAYGLVYATSSSALGQLGVGTSGQLLKSNGSAAPSWISQSDMTVGSATKATQDGNGNVITNTYMPLSGGEFTGQVIFGDSITGEDAIFGSLIVNGAGRFVNGLYGNLTGDVTGNVTGNLVGTASNASKVANSLVIKLNSGTTEGTNLFTFNGSSAKTINITPSAIGASANDHTHDYLPLSGGVLSDSFSILKTCSGTVSFDDKQNPRITLGNADGTQQISLIYTSYDSYQAPDSITLVGNQSGSYFIAPNIKATSSFYGSLSGNASTASTWKNSRTFKIGNASKTVNGSSDITWTLDEIGAASSDHTHNYLPLSGGTMSGDINFSSASSLHWNSGTYRQRIYITDDSTADTAVFTFQQSSDSGSTFTDLMTIKDNGQVVATAFIGSLSGNASTSTKWATARSITIGNTSKDLDGSGNVSWSLDEIGASSVDHTHSYIPLAGSNSITGNLQFSNISTGKRGIIGVVGDNDYWRIVGGATATDAGYLELATADGGEEPIYVRQYTGVFGTVKRTVTLLDGVGNTSFPGTVTASAFSGNASSSSKWSTARNITIGNTSKSLDGSTDVSWTLAEIGAAESNHTHDYLPLTGGEVNGQVTFNDSITGEDAILGSLIVNGAGRFVNGLYGNLTGNVTGNASTASKLASAVTVKIGNTGKSFDGSGGLTWTLDEIGASESGHNHHSDYAGSLVMSGISTSTTNGSGTVKLMAKNGSTALTTLTIGTATSDNPGLMSTEDKAKLDGISIDNVSGALQASGIISGTGITVSMNSSNQYVIATSTSYLPLSGGTMTGTLTLKGSVYEDSYTGALNANNSNIYGINSLIFADLSDSAKEGLQWYRTSTTVDSMWVKNGVMYFTPNRTLGDASATNYTIIHSGNYTDYAMPKTWANNTLYTIGDNVSMGDGNVTGCLVIKGLDGASGIQFNAYSGSTNQKMSIDGSGVMTITGTVKSTFSGNLTGDVTGNASSASKWKDSRTITLSGAVTGSVSIDGSKDVTLDTAVNHNHDSSYLKLTGGTVTGATTFSDTVVTISKTSGFIYSGMGTATTDVARPVWFNHANTTGIPVYNSNFTYNPSTQILTVKNLAGNASTATKLATARTLTIGNKGKTFDGSTDVSWTLDEIGASASGHTHDYLPLTGGEINGQVTFNDSIIGEDAILGSLIVNGAGRFVNGLYGNLTGNVTGNADTASTWENSRTFTIGNTSKPVNGSSDITWTLTEIGASASDHTHDYLPLSGGTMTGNLISTSKSTDGRYTYMSGHGFNFVMSNQFAGGIYYRNSDDTIVAAIGYYKDNYFYCGEAYNKPNGTFKAGTFVGDLNGTATNATNVAQTAVTASSYTNWRPLIFGASNSATEGFTPTTTTGALYATDVFGVQPSTGTIRATTFKGNATSSTYSTYIHVIPTSATTSTAYYPVWVSGTKADTNYYPRVHEYFLYTDLAGTSSAVGYANLALGNNIASGTAENRHGTLKLYADTAYYVNLKATSNTTSSHNIYLPDADGTIALTTSNVASATKATQDASGNVITTKYVAVDTTQTISGAKTFSNVLSVSNTTASTSKSTGALKVSGGVGVTGQVSAQALNIDDAVSLEYDSSGECLKFVFA